MPFGNRTATNVRYGLNPRIASPLEAIQRPKLWIQAGKQFGSLMEHHRDRKACLRMLTKS